MLFALITGASKGIGKSIAQTLAARGYSLLLVARSNDLLQQLSSELSARYNIKTDYLAIDLSQPDASKRVFDWCQSNNYQPSVLVNNAGFGLSGPFESYPLEQHLNMLQVNCATLVQLTHLFLPVLKKQSKGYILNIGSSAAYQAVPYLSLYAASKSLVVSFSRGLHFELRKSTVSVTCVCPGATDTEFNDRAKIGPKAMKTAQKVMMTSEDVGKEAVEAMLKEKTEVIVGVVNKLGGFLTWLLPKKVLEGAAGRIYE